MRRRNREITLAPDAVGDKQVVRFFRRFRRFHGGHLKVHDYFTHVARSDTYLPVVTFDADSVLDETNPWADGTLRTVEPPSGDVVFLAGRDWTRLEARPDSTPVINLIQHLRHADPATDLYGHLGRRAIRICVGPELGEAVVATGRANGPVIVIPNGIDADGLAALRRPSRDLDLLIVATKQPEVGPRLEEGLRAGGRRIASLTQLLPRDAFLERMASSRVAMFLPNETEGFYLPALEAMALGTIVVCPDVVGNRSFCVPGTTAFRPEYDEDALCDAAEQALGATEQARATMASAALSTARDHDLVNERTRFLEILGGIEALWRQ